ncbi:hypothetical protein DACRYDRAFT_109246 [Dacryopinax primogenitus]|uniref:Pyridoxamine 5'-phosphate oxidase Alr4036 family FMN-binding domain-containing protein n=1 Tax=Dacryopinax primogenitus (strain DJM 731) TaxID=1858805 RepID=M5G7R8_DACPD|nr:uncharacterized protein DACRYDRAFT_109246 [Dacryopinax primogenitus]EJT99822.1 hypothetical protein DACRYDRAFT_109246 [Dacryopinax primogenitus]
MEWLIYAYAFLFTSLTQVKAIARAIFNRTIPAIMFEPAQPIVAQTNYVQPYRTFTPPVKENKDTYGKTLTHFQFPWPIEINGIERVVLSAKGDLQRVLSAYFGSPISVSPIFQTPASSIPVSSEASPSTPITQHRVVHLLCASKLVVVATSTVHLYTPRAASLLLDEKYAIGQCYRVMGQNPEFELDKVWLDNAATGEERVTRRYRLSTEEMMCEIEEVFVDRKMFREESWLYA